MSRRGFSTLDFPVEQRNLAWRDYLRDNLFDADYRDLSGEGIACEHVSLEFDGGRVHGFASSQHVVDRTARALDDAVSGPDAPHLYVTMLVSGQAMYWSDSLMAIAEPGDAFLYDPADPFFLTFQRQSRLLLFEFGPDALSSGASWRGRPCRKAGAEVLGARARELAAGVYADLHGAAGGRLARDREVAALTAAIGRAATETLEPGHYVEALAVIRERLADPELTVEAVAREVHVSTRQLLRVFRDHGSTIARTIARERVARAKRLLTTTDLPIGEIARRCGFGSTARLTRTFTQSVGATPSALRRDASLTPPAVR